MLAAAASTALSRWLAATGTTESTAASCDELANVSDVFEVMQIITKYGGCRPTLGLALQPTLERVAVAS